MKLCKLPTLVMMKLGIMTAHIVVVIAEVSRTKSRTGYFRKKTKVISEQTCARPGRQSAVR